VSSAESPPKQQLKKIYAGWVPTVSGRLSFRHIGDSRFPTPAITANVNCANERLIVSYQRRPLSDALFRWAIHHLYGIRGDFWFALTVRSKDAPIIADRLEGRIYVYKSREDWRARADDEVGEAIREMEGLRFSDDPNQPAQMLAQYESARTSLSKTADIVLDFTLERTGEFYISKPWFRDKELEYGSENYAKHAGHDFGKWVADQSYFFMRDISHAHQHHHPASDTILILQERDVKDIGWRKKIIYSLYYAIIRMKRANDTFAPIVSQGLHAYCLSFKNICENKFSAATYKTFPEFSDEALKQSLDSKSQELFARHTMRYTAVSTARAIALTFAAIYIATLAIFIQPRIGLDDKQREQFSLIHKLSDWLAANFDVALYVCVLFVGLVFILSERRWALKTPIFRDILEVSNVNRVRSAIFLIFLSIGIAIGFGYWFFPAVKEISDFFYGLGRILF
jgi:hypothetical protein